MTSISVLYTADLNGDLALLPRLYTFLKRLRAEFAADRVLLIDLGNACAPAVWHCTVTGGRSMLIALDGMGYDAANVIGYLEDQARGKLLELGEIVRLNLIDAPGVFVCEGLKIAMPVADTTRMDGDVLRLVSVGTGEVGVAHLVRARDEWRLDSFGVYAIAPGTLPDPTIAGMVDFITAEARYAQKKRSSGTSAESPDGEC